MSHTLTLEVPEEVYESLLKVAEQTGQPPESLAVRWLAQASRRDSDDPLEEFIGAFPGHGSGGGSDWADRHDWYLGEAALGAAKGLEDEG